MRISRTTRKDFTRQILESVQIQSNNRKHIIMNSKSEFNRCALPRLTVRLGESNAKIKKEKKDEKIAEKS